jgi:hypothetical protein
MMRSMLLSLAGLTALCALYVAPANAQGYPLYPWCAQTGRGGSNCYFSTWDQCRAAARYCYQNPFYVAYGSCYSFGGQAVARTTRSARRYRQH